MISGFEQIVIEERENAKKEGLEQGTSREKERGIQILLETCRELGQTMDTAVEKLVQKYALSAEEARELAEQYFKN